MILAIVMATTVAQAGAGVTFDDVLEAVMKGNPEVAAAAASNQAEIESMKAENMLEGPEIEGHHSWGNYGDRKYGAGISQGFDWPGLYSARRGVIKAMTEAKTYLNRSTVFDKTIEAKLLLIDLVQSRRTLDLMKRMLKSMTEMQSTLDKSYENGEVSILDKNKLDIEVIRLTSKVNDAQIRYATLLTAVQNLAGETPVKEMARNLSDYPADTVLSEEEYERTIAENDPMINYYRAMGDAASRQQDVARMQGAPSFSLGYEWEREEGQNFNGITFGMKFSSWSTRHSRAAARLSKMENEVQLNATRLTRLADMRNELASVREFSSQVEAYSRILDRGDQEKLLRRALEGGEIGMLTYLQEMNFFIEARVDYEEACYELSQAKARLNKICRR